MVTLTWFEVQWGDGSDDGWLSDTGCYDCGEAASFGSRMAAEKAAESNRSRGFVSRVRKVTATWEVVE